MLKLALFSALVGLSMALPGRLPQPASVIFPHLQAPAEPTYSHTFGRILGGADAVDFQFPYIAAVNWQATSGGSFICGASIISDTILLTAAHCVVDAASPKIPAGTTQWRDAETDAEVAKGAQVRDVTTFEAHVDFDRPENDIGYLKLDDLDRLPVGEDVGGNIPIDVIPLAAAEPAQGDIATVAGWGKTSNDGGVASDLQFAQVPVVADAEFVTAYGNIVPEDQVICVFSGAGITPTPCNSDCTLAPSCFAST